MSSVSVCRCLNFVFLCLKPFSAGSVLSWPDYWITTGEFIIRFTQILLIATDCLYVVSKLSKLQIVR